MGDESHVQRLLAEIQAARAEVTNRNISTDEKFKRFDELVKLVEKQQSAINSLSLKVGRPGADTGASSEREQAIALLEQRHASRVTKSDPDHPFVPDEVGIEEASLAIRAAKKMLKVATIEALNPTERKALSSFTLGSSGFILPPEMSSKILLPRRPDRRDRLGGEHQHQRTVDQVRHRQCEHGRAVGVRIRLLGTRQHQEPDRRPRRDGNKTREHSPRRVRQPRVS